VLDDLLGGVCGGEIRGGDGETSESAVEGLAGFETCFGFGGGGQDGADVLGGGEALEHAAVEEGLEGGVEVDDEGAGGLFEEEAIGEFFGGSAAEGQDRGGAGESVGKRGGFEPAEVLFALVGEESRDGGAGAGLKVSIEVEEVPAEGFCQQAADGGLAGTHEAGENDAFEIWREHGGFGLDRAGFRERHEVLSWESG